ELAGRATAVAMAKVEEQGQAVSCGAGCGACCRQLVAISFVEARALADLVAALPSQRRAEIRARFADGVRRLEEAGLLDPAQPPGQRALQVNDLADRGQMTREVS